MMFDLIKNIDIKNTNTWKNKIFLTFDLDWCSDEILEYTLEILEEYNVKATFFVTHNTKLLHKINKNPNFDLGIHPNFNFLLNGNFKYGKNIEEVIKFYLDIVPDAKYVRSHSLTQSSLILNFFKNLGLKYSCNTFIPFSSGIEIKPFVLFNGLIECPHFWEDDIHLIYKWKWEVEKFLNYKGLKIFNFHPIHIFLNTNMLEKYESTKKHIKNYKELKKFVNKTNYGVRYFLMDLICEVNKSTVYR